MINIDKKHHNHKLAVYTNPKTKFGESLHHPGVLRCLTCDNAYLQWLGHYHMEMLHDLVEGPDEPKKPTRKQINKHVKKLIKDKQQGKVKIPYLTNLNQTS
jgi:hypothetical protein